MSTKKNCDYCKTPLIGSKPKKCTKCKAVFYCNTTCQTKDWPKHKLNCVEKINLDNTVFILGHSNLDDNVFRLPDDVNVITYSKCGELLVSSVTLQECMELDRCELGVKPHIYRGVKKNIINDMKFNFNPINKYLINGKIYEDRQEFPIFGIKLFHETVDLELLNIRDEEISPNGIYSKFHFFSKNKKYVEDKEKFIQDFLKGKSISNRDVIEAMSLDYDELQYKKWKASGGESKQILGLKDEDPRLFIITDLFIKKMTGKSRITDGDRTSIKKFFVNKKYKVKLSDILKEITNKSDLRNFSVNGCRKYNSSIQDRQILNTKTGRVSRLHSNEQSGFKEKNTFRHTSKHYKNRKDFLEPYQLIPLGKFLELQGKILGFGGPGKKKKPTKKKEKTTKKKGEKVKKEKTTKKKAKQGGKYKSENK